MSRKDDDTINLRDQDDKPEFKIEHFNEDEIPQADLSKTNDEGKPQIEAADEVKSSEKVRVSFEKFVNLVANHEPDEIYDHYANEEVIISTALLTDLASTTESKSDKKISIFFIVGIILGIVITLMFIKY